MKKRALAKINIFLKVTGKRDDGYNKIETIFLPLENLYDEISVKINNSNKRPQYNHTKCKSDTQYKNKEKSLLAPTTCGIKILSNTTSIPLNEDNICHKAAIQFAKIANITPSWDIMIEKNIPISAGLGGGSSDAGTLLMILSEMYPQVKKKEIFNIACKLGADVPFFLNPTPSLAHGIGEILEPLKNIKPLHLVIVNPLFPVSAKWGYNNFIPYENNIKVQDMIKTLQENDLILINKLFTNDLEQAVFNKFPIMNILKNDLIDFGALSACMSGSGPTLFAIASDKAKASKILNDLNTKYDNTIFAITAKTLV